jgi:hypothetical protein
MSDPHSGWGKFHKPEPPKTPEKPRKQPKPETPAEEVSE